MGVQELLRKEWGPFNGLYANVIGSAVPSGYALTATDCRLDNGVLEVEPGDEMYNSAINTGSGYTENTTGIWSIHTSDVGVNQILFCNGDYIQNITSTTANAIAHTTGTATITNGSATVTGSGTSWLSHVAAGDYIKRTVDADTAYQIITTVGSDTSITLTAVWAGSSTSGSQAYTIRKTVHSNANYLSMSGKIFNGYLINTDGVDTMTSYNGTTHNNVASSPLAFVLETHKNRLFAANTVANPSRLFWSAVNNPLSWDTTNAQTDVFALDGGGEIVAIKSYKNRLFVFKERAGLIYEVIGDFSTTTGSPDTIVKVIANVDLGRIKGRTLVEFRDLLWFFTSTGLYVFDGTSIKLASRAFESYLLNDASIEAVTLRNKYSAIVFKDRLYLNLRTQFAIFDRDEKVTLQSYAGASSRAGDFTISAISGSYRLYAVSGLRLLRIETGVIRYGLAGATVNVNSTLVYEIGDDYLDSPEYNKDFYKFYIVAEETASANSILFDYDIDLSGTYVTNTLTLTGTANKIQVFEVAVRPYSNITSASRGRCIRWRIRGNNTAVNFRVIKVILRYGLMSLR